MACEQCATEKLEQDRKYRDMKPMTTRVRDRDDRTKGRNNNVAINGILPDKDVPKLPDQNLLKSLLKRLFPWVP